MSFDDFYPQKRPYSSLEKKTGQTDGDTDGWTDNPSYSNASTYLKQGRMADTWHKMRLVGVLFTLENNWGRMDGPTNRWTHTLL